MNRNDLIEAVNASKIQRWFDLRVRADSTLIPLENDDTLKAQLAGLTRHCEMIAKLFNYKAAPADVALAYVARQLEGLGTGRNTMFNARNLTRSRLEGAALYTTASKLDANEGELWKVFTAVSDALRDKKSESPIKKMLERANALFYIETGVQAALWSKHEAANESDRQIALILAANALGNNYFKYQSELALPLKSILAPIRADNQLMASVTTHERYLESLKKIKGYKPPQ